MIDKASIEQLKNIIDIVDVVGNYIELKKAGSNYKALCPFHDEDTPSFVVSPSKQIYHCFGCGAGGDAIKFVMEYEKLSYPEAIEKLASIYNFSLRHTQGHSTLSPLFKALESINDFYKSSLAHNRKALDYLRQRGLSSASIEKFSLGYAPDSSSQIRHLKSHLIPLQDAVEAGILAKEGERIYARMIERITFPIHSPKGAIVAFGGRTITNHPAKYLNSPETKLFHKSKILYGYHIAKDAIFKKRQIIVCEGYMDVVMLHQGGFDTAVATLGTALTAGHLPLLTRAEPKVILAYDSDKAGINAARKASRLLAAHDIEGGVVIFPVGLDPADMIHRGEQQKLRKLFAQPKPFIEFLLEAIVSSYDLANPKEKQKALFEGIEFLKSIPPLVAQEYRDYLAALLGILPSKVQLERPRHSSSRPAAIETKDAKELSIIKTILLHPHLIDTVLDIIDTEHIVYHKEEFRLALEQQLDHPKIRAILLDDDIIAFDEESLHKELLVFLIKYYENKIRRITRSTMPFEQKSYLIRKYKEYIVKLKRGEMIIE